MGAGARPALGTAPPAVRRLELRRGLWAAAVEPLLAQRGTLSGDLERDPEALWCPSKTRAILQKCLHCLRIVACATRVFEELAFQLTSTPEMRVLLLGCLCFARLQVGGRVLPQLV